MSDPSTGLVFDVQRFSLHDGPGIRTVVFFKGCSLDCVWCQNPEAQGMSPELAYYEERCLEGCSTCVSTCPHGAIRDVKSGRIDWDACVGCGDCVSACPTMALRNVGERRSADDLLDELARDRPFFESSGGGVTFSGGEPVLHHAFLGTLLPKLKAEGYHVTIETAGSYPYELLENLLPHIDRVLFDLKHADSQRHLELCGRPNDAIVENLRTLLATDTTVEVRMPVIPTLNDGDNITATAGALRALGVSELTLLPYNRLWEAKLTRLSERGPALGIDTPPSTYYEEVLRAFETAGVDAHLAEAQVSLPGVEPAPAV